MPVEKIVRDTNRCWGLWLIQENEEELQKELGNDYQVPDSFTNLNKRLEWLAGRLLIRALLHSMNLPFNGIVKDQFGKPFLKNLPHHISLSHSYPYVAVIIDHDKTVGIDLEQPKEKLLKIAPRILAYDELADAGEDITKHCVYWCAKEALIKVYGKKDLTLAENLIISPFQLESEGNITGRIIVKNTVTTIPLTYQVVESFVIVFNQ